MMNQMQTEQTMELPEIVSVDESVKITMGEALEEYKSSFYSLNEQVLLSKVQIEKVIKNARLMEDRIKELEVENADYQNLVETMQNEIDKLKEDHPTYEADEELIAEGAE